MDVMIDLETTGLKPGCGILAIGAVPFDTHEQRGLRFYERVKPTSNLDVGLVHENETLDWWDLQSDEAYYEAWGGKIPLRAVLVNFTLFLNHLNQPVRLWGNAASFDLKILEAAYKVCELPVPWKYTDEMCYRTLKNLFPNIIAPDFVGLKHSALADAENQATHAEFIMQHVRYKGAFI